MGKKKVLPVLGGVAVGAGLGVLFAPKKGSETRKELADKFNDLIKEVKKIDKEDAKDYIENAIKDLKSEIESLDKEEILEIARAKAEVVQEKASKLVKYTKKRGEEELEKAAEALRKTAINVSKEVIKKLEK